MCWGFWVYCLLKLRGRFCCVILGVVLGCCEIGCKLRELRFWYELDEFVCCEFLNLCLICCVCFLVLYWDDCNNECKVKERIVLNYRVECGWYWWRGEKSDGCLWDNKCYVLNMISIRNSVKSWWMKCYMLWVKWRVWFFIIVFRYMVIGKNSFVVFGYLELIISLRKKVIVFF